MEVADLHEVGRARVHLRESARTLEEDATALDEIGLQAVTAELRGAAGQLLDIYEALCRIAVMGVARNKEDD
jgi:hypothetical protein